MSAKTRAQTAWERQIVGLRRQGVSTARLAAEFNVTQRRVQQICRDFKDVDTDAPEGVQVGGLDEALEHIARLQLAVEDLAVLAVKATNEAVRLGAIRQRVETERAILQLKIDHGLLPAHFGGLSVEQERELIARRLLDALRETDADDAVVRALSGVFAKGPVVPAELAA